VVLAELLRQASPEESPTIPTSLEMDVRDRPVAYSRTTSA